jgi:shikimate kinase
VNKRNIFLTGFMGAGKSTIGRRLAHRLGYSFSDLDDLIVAREGRPIPEIFAVHGEAYFRDCEAAVLADQRAAGQVVFATGGGIVGRVENRELMKQIGCVVYLRAAWPTLEQRLARGKGRPLADPQKGLDSVRQLWQERLLWYEEADVVIDTDRLRVNEVVGRIISMLGFKESVQCSR